jgi:glutamate-1-semialdehyde 2,1-aminomutase
MNASQISPRLARARQHYADRSVESLRLHQRACEVLPGGNTRSLFYGPPFPVTFVSGHDSVLVDADGREYVDFLGDYTAGIFGHSDRRAVNAAFAALHNNTSVGGIHPAEQELARLMCQRWDLELVRFTNSGTEANIMAITAARLHTNRSKVMVMYGGYHGGVLYFASGVAAWNVPFPYVVGEFNDLDTCVRLIRENGDDLAAVLVEPLLGSGGCIQTTPRFLNGLAEAAHEVGALIIADEVMTSRTGPHGVAAELGLQPDLKTFGKYIAGGFSFGAFGGRSQIMSRFDLSKPGTVPHGGTFNNNITSVSAGVEVLTHMYTAEIASSFTARGEEFRANLAAVLARYPALGLSQSGLGTMMSIHARPEAPTNGHQSAQRDAEVQELVYLGLLQRGHYIAQRGMINLSLTITDDQLADFLGALDDVCQELQATA